MQKYFAKASENNEYSTIDPERISEAGGWTVTLNALGEIIDGDHLEGISSFSLQDITDLTNGIYQYNGDLYFASIANYMQDGGLKIVVAILPADNAGTTCYIDNIPDIKAKLFIILFILCNVIIVTLYILIKIIVKRLNNIIVSPILAIAQALEELKFEEYNISLDFKVKNEFVFIKNAFDLMLQRLSDAQILQKERQSQKINVLKAIRHELNTPITIITGLLQAIMSGKVTSKKASQYIKIIYNNIKMLSEIIEVKLDFTILDQEYYKSMMIKQSLSEIIRKFIITNYALCEELEIDLDINIPASDIFCVVDNWQLNRAFNNLLNNAIFHNSHIHNLKIGIHLREEGHNAKIFFADTGDPIPESVKELLLFQASPKKEASKSGTDHGVGLLITQKIVELHSGYLNLDESYEQYNKAFVITLPLS